MKRCEWSKSFISCDFWGSVAAGWIKEAKQNMLVRESRALFGAIALIVTGAILSSMAHQYFAGQYTDEAIVRSRSWWEVVLNLQVLSLAFMWFCYADRVRVEDRKRALIMRFRMAFGLIAVSVPFFIALTAVYYGWFETRPSMKVVDLIVCYMLFFWAFSTVMPKLIALRFQRNESKLIAVWHKLKPRSVLATLPALFGLVIILLDVLNGAGQLYYLLPVLFYLQAAMPFLFKAFAKEAVAFAAE